MTEPRNDVIDTGEIVLRSPSTEEELRAFYEPLFTAFGEEVSPGELEAERPIMELDRLINAFEGERRVASAGAFSHRLTVPGGEIPACGITAVGVVPDAREDEPQLGPLRADEGERLEQAGMVLVRPRARGVEEERLTVDAGRRREPLVVDTQVDRVHACALEAEPLDDPLLDPFADHDHACRAPGSAVVGESPEHPLAAREELRQVEMLHVEERQHGWALDARDRARVPPRAVPGLAVWRPDRAQACARRSSP